MTKNTYSLFLETDKGLLSIPCVNIEDFDKYTIRFTNDIGIKNKELFLRVLINMLNVKISVNDIKRVCLSIMDRDDYEFDYNYCYPVKYSGDNYNLESLISYFGQFLKDDRNRLMMFKESASRYIFRYHDGTYTDSDIDFFAKIYLNKRYRNHRDVYFLLNELGYPVRIDKVKNVRQCSEHFVRMDKLNESANEHIQYLIELASRGEEEYERAIDELSRNDLEELNRYLDKTSHGIVDGVSDITVPTEEDIELFEEVTGMSISALQNMCREQLSNGRKR